MIQEKLAIILKIIGSKPTMLVLSSKIVDHSEKEALKDIIKNDLDSFKLADTIVGAHIGG